MRACVTRTGARRPTWQHSPRPFRSHSDEYITFYGAANPPATYGGVGGTTRDKARYSFVVPSGFKEDAVSKVRVFHIIITWRIAIDCLRGRPTTADWISLGFRATRILQSESLSGRKAAIKTTRFVVFICSTQRMLTVRYGC